ncbi:hypothetical protein CYFUS_005931 [Cystobacter fuscus]|uniref:Exo-alpha-sialidase n=1 Tax=Cystobacter fuscus TaxID=43 RepID=A0A250JAI5_9BACT|nr:hypothetical protein [Cystobacter fuscus]ATB40482.1 hypothetical protein CYFUS_005931 [Cystobacter fuscus]
MIIGSVALLAAVLASTSPVLPVKVGNALTLPAQRHAVRLETGGGRPATWLLAIQQEGVEGRGLSFYRSEDEGRTFRFYVPIQPDGSHADRADLVAVGRDVALVYSWESPSLRASSRHDVYFQWWRYQPDSHDWKPEPAVRIFNADDSTAYTRALLARDSQGRLWVQAFHLDSDGGSTAVLSVSSDGGASFQRQANLGRVKRRGGGRLLSVGSKLVFLYAMHDGFEPTRMRIRRDSDPVESWGDVKTAFSDGIYHGAALSAVEDGEGGMHLVYKDETERLYYRHFDGTSFGSRTLLESSRDWAMQAAVTRVGKTLYVFYNVMRSAGRAYEIHARTLEDGRFSDPVVLDSKRTFKGYPNALDTLPEGVDDVPCFFGEAPDDNSRGNMVRVRLDAPGGGGSEPPPPTEPSEDTPSPGRELFRDDFSSNSSSGLGSDWSLSGLWLSNGKRAVSDLDNPDGNNQALAPLSSCRDCQVEAWLQHFAADEAGVVLRARGDAFYALVYLPSGRIQIRRYRDGKPTVLAEAASGQSSAWEGATFTLAAWGTQPVQLAASVNGQVRLRVTDTSSSAPGDEGLAGLLTPIAGIWFDDFRVRALESD